MANDMCVHLGGLITIFINKILVYYVTENSCQEFTLLLTSICLYYIHQFYALKMILNERLSNR